MRLFVPIAFLLLLLPAARFLSAQQIDPTTPPLPPPSVVPVAPPEPVFDPLHAEKSIEIGTFYMKRGNYDAAIDRFEEATHYQPGLARPWRMLGEAYEKKRDSANAIKSYTKYLEVLPRAQDAEKVKKRIAALQEKAGQEATRRTPR